MSQECQEKPREQLSFSPHRIQVRGWSWCRFQAPGGADADPSVGTGPGRGVAPALVKGHRRPPKCNHWRWWPPALFVYCGSRHGDGFGVDDGGRGDSIGSERCIRGATTRPRWPVAGGASGSGGGGVAREQAALVAGGEELDAAGSGRSRRARGVLWQRDLAFGGVDRRRRWGSGQQGGLVFFC